MERSGKSVIAAISVAACFSPFTTEAFAGYQGVAVVAKSGGQYTDPVDAMNKIQEWCPTLSAAKPRCLLKIMPGVYSLGTRTLKMREYVDIEGAGETMTLISGKSATSAGYDATLSTGLVVGASNAEVRFLGISATDQAAFFNNNASPLLTHLAISATGSEPYGGIYGIYNVASSPRITDVNIYARRGGHVVGIYNSAASAPRMQQVRVTAKDAMSLSGVTNVDSSPEMLDMTIRASEAEGCNGVTNVNSSPKMVNVSVAASHCAYGAIGVANGASSPVMINVTASGETSNYCAGITNSSSSSPVMTNVTAIATDGQDESTGIYNSSSSAVLSNVTASGSHAGMVCYAHSGENHKIFVDRSTFTGTSSVISTVGTSLQIGGSKLAGPVSAHGPVSCVNSYSGDYLPLNNVCQ